MTEMMVQSNINMLCEYSKQPVGLTTVNPHFYFSINDSEVQIRAHRIVVTDDKLQTTLWDSGFINQLDNDAIIYEGEKLSSGVTYIWELFLQLEKDNETFLISQKSSFTMGLLAPDSWISSWITATKIDQSSYLYRSQWVNRKEVIHGAAFVASPCYYVLTVNGKRADDTVLNNVFADYDKSIYYRTYDITDLLNPCGNAVGIMTGLGWHSLREAEDGIGWGESLFSMQIRLEYTDGTVEWICSNPGDWTFSTQGPVQYNSIYNGEIYDANKEIENWDSYGFNDTHFTKAVEAESPGGQLRSQFLEPIRVVHRFAPAQMIEVGDGSYTLDFGQNFSGWVKLRMRGSKGQKVSIKPAELINSDGSVNPISLRNAHPVDTYILKGNAVEEYEPLFTYHGFRYAQIYGLTNKPDLDMFTGCFVRTDADRIGSFSSDNEILNGFYRCVCQTEESNIHGIPTDCPQRDERLGWLNDMTVRHEGALYNYRLYQLYTKWLRDIRDAQGKTTGAVTDTAPFMRYGFRPADPVSSCFLMIPWNLYLHYGDDAVIRENYQANAAWVDYLKRNSTNYIVNFSSMGDWASPIAGTDPNSTGGGAISTITPGLLMSTGHFYFDCTIMEKMARVLGKKEEEDYYHFLSKCIKDAFNATYFDSQKKSYASGSQGANVIALYFHLVPPEYEEGVLENLCQDIMVTNNGHLTTGNICTKYAMEVLFQYGKDDIAWYLLTQKDYPGWGYMIENGATTMWERWEKVQGDSPEAAMASMNHPMNGGAVVCLHKYLAGILPDEENPGYKHVIIRPHIPRDAKEIYASVETIKGRVSCKWHRINKEVIYDIEIPSGSSATICLPGAHDTVKVTSGKHQYHVLESKE